MQGACMSNDGCRLVVGATSNDAEADGSRETYGRSLRLYALYLVGSCSTLGTKRNLGSDEPLYCMCVAWGLAAEVRQAVHTSAVIVALRYPAPGSLYPSILTPANRSRRLLADYTGIL
jgi:hypothetical protein